MQSWAEHADRRLAEAGFRRGGARAAVIGLLDRQACALSAYDIEDALRADGRGVARASVYRVLDELVGLALVTRVEVGQGSTRYEAARPDGDHHHHMVCDRCGDVQPFADDDLERAVDRLADRVAFAVAEHEIVLHGECAGLPRVARSSGQAVRVEMPKRGTSASASPLSTTALRGPCSIRRWSARPSTRWRSSPATVGTQFAIGTGRIALPLAQRGVRVAGIDNSEAMLARLRDKPGADRIAAVAGDMAATRVDGDFALVYLVFNTIFNLTTQDGQVACFQNAAAHLRSGGRFVIEGACPSCSGSPLGQTVLPWRADPDGMYRLRLRRRHPAAKRPALLPRGRRMRAADRDALRLAGRAGPHGPPGGPAARHRWAGWRGEPLTDLSPAHVSVYRVPSSPTTPGPAARSRADGGVASK